MGVMTDLHAESLPCGADVAALVEQVGDGWAGERSAHQATCPYCQTALEELGRLWAPVDRFARAPVRVPAGMAVAVLGRLRELVGGGGQVLLGGERGVTRVSMWALGRMAALAAAGVPGVRAVLGRVVNARGERRSGRPPVAVELELVTEYGDSAVEVGEAVRRRVRAELATLAGVDAETVDVTVEDVAGPEWVTGPRVPVVRDDRGSAGSN
jgi:uncharacterized alkaline shock family protein YloU